MVLKRLEKGWSSYDQQYSSHKTWLRTVLRNETVSFLRLNRYQPMRGYGLVENHPSASVGIDDASTNEHYHQLSEELIEKCKEEIRDYTRDDLVDRNIYIFEGKLKGVKEKVIAQNLGIERGTVASVWFRTRELLNNTLKKEYQKMIDSYQNFL